MCTPEWHVINSPITPRSELSGFAEIRSIIHHGRPEPDTGDIEAYREGATYASRRSVQAPSSHGPSIGVRPPSSHAGYQFL